MEKILHLSQTDLSILSQQAKQEAQKYSSENFYQKILKTYEQALSKHHYCYRVVSISPENQQQYTVAFQFDHHQILLLFLDK